MKYSMSSWVKNLGAEYTWWTAVAYYAIIEVKCQVYYNTGRENAQPYSSTSFCVHSDKTALLAIDDTWIHLRLQQEAHRVAFDSLSILPVECVYQQSRIF